MSRMQCDWSCKQLESHTEYRAYSYYMNESLHAECLHMRRVILMLQLKAATIHTADTFGAKANKKTKK
jgi:hypothetical protein